MAGKLSQLIKYVLPKKGSKSASAYTNTYNPSLSGSLLSTPGYTNHLNDLASERQSYDSRTILKNLLKYDPDVSAATNAYLTVADTSPVIYVRAPDGSFDLEGLVAVNQLIQTLCSRTDYSKGYAHVTGLRALCERMRYMVLLRGAVGAELVLDKYHLPRQLNLIDMATVYWKEPAPGEYVPEQRASSTGATIDLGALPTFFTAFFRQDPTEIYPEGIFVSAINTIAARQQVINDLYRIMQVSGYPRIEVTVLEEVLLKNAPASIADDPQKRRDWVTARLSDIAGVFSSLRPDQAFVHTDASSVKVINDKAPGMAVDISHVIAVLNGQNQAALKTMATIIGRGESGTNTASVEARVFSMNADQVNIPVGDILSQALTYALRLHGSESIVAVSFRQAELRSLSELEPQLTLKQARLLELLSLGVISDVEFSMEMFGRPPLPGTQPLSGTGFMKVSTVSEVTDRTNPNDTPLGRSQTGEGGKQAKNMTKSKAVNG